MAAKLSLELENKTKKGFDEIVKDLDRMGVETKDTEKAVEQLNKELESRAAANTAKQMKALADEYDGTAAKARQAAREIEREGEAARRAASAAEGAATTKNANARAAARISAEESKGASGRGSTAATITAVSTGTMALIGTMRQLSEIGRKAYSVLDDLGKTSSQYKGLVSAIDEVGTAAGKMTREFAASKFGAGIIATATSAVKGMATAVESLPSAWESTQRAIFETVAGIEVLAGVEDGVHMRMVARLDKEKAARKERLREMEFEIKLKQSQENHEKVFAELSKQAAAQATETFASRLKTGEELRLAEDAILKKMKEQRDAGVLGNAEAEQHQKNLEAITNRRIKLEEEWVASQKKTREEDKKASEEKAKKQKEDAKKTADDLKTEMKRRQDVVLAESEEERQSTTDRKTARLSALRDQLAQTAFTSKVRQDTIGDEIAAEAAQDEASRKIAEARSNENIKRARIEELQKQMTMAGSDEQREKILGLQIAAEMDLKRAIEKTNEVREKKAHIDARRKALQEELDTQKAGGEARKKLLREIKDLEVELDKLNAKHAFNRQKEISQGLWDQQRFEKERQRLTKETADKFIEEENRKLAAVQQFEAQKKAIIDKFAAFLQAASQGGGGPMGGGFGGGGQGPQMPGGGMGGGQFPGGFKPQPKKPATIAELRARIEADKRLVFEQVARNRADKEVAETRRIAKEKNQPWSKDRERRIRAASRGRTLRDARQGKVSRAEGQKAVSQLLDKMAKAVEDMAKAKGDLGEGAIEGMKKQLKNESALAEQGALFTDVLEILNNKADVVFEKVQGNIKRLDKLLMDLGKILLQKQQPVKNDNKKDQNAF